LNCTERLDQKNQVDLENYPPFKIAISFIVVIGVVYLFRLFIGQVPIEVGQQAISVPDIHEQITTQNLSKTPLVVDPVKVPSDLNTSRELKHNKADRVSEIPHFINTIPLIDPIRTQSTLIPFYSALKRTQDNGERTRIFFYGDSQIEGGRIVRFLRQFLQEAFGGSGMGLLCPVERVYVNLDYEIEASKHGQKVQLLPGKPALKGKPYGVGLYYALFTSDRAEFAIKPRQTLDTKPYHNQGIVYYRNPGTSATLTLSTDSGNQDISLPATTDIQAVPFRTLPSDEAVHFALSQGENLTISGISYESSGGIIVDQFPLRGSAGLEFSSVDFESFRSHAALLNPDLVILQYGINVVPARRSNFDYYRQLLIREIKAIREMMPDDIPIVLIGVSDMARALNGQVRPYESVNKVSMAMAASARQSGAVFFDLLTFMGGPGASVDWVNSDPPLLRQDYTHFTIAGGALVAEELFKLLMSGYEQFISDQGDGR